MVLAHITHILRHYRHVTADYMNMKANMTMHIHLPPCQSHLAAQGLVNLNMTEVPSDASSVSVPAAQKAVTFKEQGFKICL